MARLNPIELSPIRGQAQSDDEVSLSESESNVSNTPSKHRATGENMATPGGVLGLLRRSMSLLGGSPSGRKHTQAINEHTRDPEPRTEDIEHEDVNPDVEEEDQSNSSSLEDPAQAEAAEADNEGGLHNGGQATGEANNASQEALGDPEAQSTPTNSQSVTSTSKPSPRLSTRNTVRFKKDLKHTTHARGVVRNGKGLSTADLYEPDTDDIPSGKNGVGDQAEKVNGDRPAKRQKLITAKAPLMYPKGPTLRGQGKARAGPREPSPFAESNQSIAGPAVKGLNDGHKPVPGSTIDDEVDVQHVRPHKKRGRPRKVAQGNEAFAAEQVENMDRHEPQQAELLGVPDKGGVSEILMDMSPVKPAFPHVASRTVQQPMEGTEDKLFMPRPIQDDAEGDEAEVENEDEDESFESVPRPSQSSSLIYSGTDLIDISFLSQLRIVAYQVGHRDGRDGPEKIRNSEAYTPIGLELSKNIEKLRSTYSVLQSAREQRSKLKIQMCQEKVQVFTDAIDATVREHLDGAISKRLLKDLYFSIMPRLTRCVECCGKAHVIEGSMETPSLQEFANLLKLLERTAQFAINQDAGVQPRANGNVSYKISQPTRRVLPAVRKLHKRVIKELGKRERAERLAEKERMRPDLESQYEEKQRQEEAERERRRKINRQERSLYLQRQLNDPIRGPQIAKILWPTAPHGPIPPQLVLYAKKLAAEQRNTEESSVEDDPFAEVEENREVRLEVFGKNNTNKNSQVRKLTKEERKVFMLTLKRERGPDRYQIAAQRLELTLEEVFGYAKDLQEMMDRKHQNGEYEASEGYGWTYEIWVGHR